MHKPTPGPKTIYYYADPGIQWVQGWRFQILKKMLGDQFDIRDISRTFFIRRRLGQGFFAPCYVSTWRRLLKNDIYKKLPLENFMTSVTSHYNLGGGLNPSMTVGTVITEPEEVYKKAIDILRRFSVVTVNSLRLFEMLSTDVKNVIYAPNGVDTEFFSPPKKPEPFSSRADKKFRVGWVGKIKSAKNYELVTELKQYLKKNSELGSRIEFKEIVIDKNHPDVQSQEMVRDFYHNLDFYLCTSWHEGTPNPCLEAASAGLPLITTRVGNMPELIKEGKNGYFIDPNLDSVVAVLKNLISLTDSEYSHLSHEARNEIEQHWTWQKQITNYRLAFERLIGS